MTRASAVDAMKDLRRTLEQVEAGQPGAVERLSELLYDEIRGVARRQLAEERADHTLQPTALANEVYLRLAGADGDGFESRSQFLGAVAVAVRRVLIEHARRRARLKRGGDRVRLDVERLDPAGEVPDETLLELDEALERLALFSPDHARTVELRFFAGMTLEEVAEQRGRSISTIQREWRFARAWLRGELEAPDGA